MTDSLPRLYEGERSSRLLQGQGKTCGTSFDPWYSCRSRQEKPRRSYATLEIEYPRQGLIRITDTDRTLIDLRNSMN
jgi:hypothetical protein